MKSAYKKMGSWIAIFAMLLTSFMPLISHAVESKNNTHNIERVCTSQGIRFISAENHSPDKSPTKIKHADCNYCSISSDKSYLLPINTQLGAAVIPTSSKFFLEYESPILVAYFRTSFSPQAPPLV
jgi:hypothetical protein